MDNQITKNQEQIQVVLAGEQKYLPKETLLNLPEIVRNEIMFPKLNGLSEESLISRADTTARIISMLDVKFKGETKEDQDAEMNLAQMEFNTFLRGYYLTGKEVIEAYRMALSGNLNYKVYPTLSLIQCGEILEMYQGFKTNSIVREKALKRLKSENEIKEEIDYEKNKLRIRRKGLQRINPKRNFRSCRHLPFKIKRAGKTEKLE